MEHGEDHITRANATLSTVEAECEAGSGSYRFDVGRTTAQPVALHFVGAASARVVVKSGEEILNEARIDMSAAQSQRIALSE